MIHIKWIKIGGVNVYKAKPKVDDEKEEDQQPATDLIPEPVED